MSSTKPEHPNTIVDVRASFARHLHTLAAQASVDLEHVLRFTDVNHDGQDAVGSAPDTPTLIVPGLLGNSVRTLVAPLFCARERLAVKGYRTEIVWVSGRSGCDRNARSLRQKVLARSRYFDEPVILIGYSKGCADIMHMLAQYPDTHDSVRALVSLGGVVFGTPLADSVGRWTDSLLRYLPLPNESIGDGLAIHDMRPDFRRKWLAENPLPQSVRYASVVAVPEPHNVSRILRAPYRHLARVDQDNDSQVIDHAAMLPHSELLATVNADHWAIALPLAERNPWLERLGIDRNHFPRTLLLQGIIDWLG